MEEMEKNHFWSFFADLPGIGVIFDHFLTIHPELASFLIIFCRSTRNWRHFWSFFAGLPRIGVIFYYLLISVTYSSELYGRNIRYE